jgi:hypothetical protein
MERFESILQRLDDIRAQEQAIAQQEEDELAEFLNPRQRAVLLMMRMQFNDRLRQMRGMRGDGPPMPPGGMGGGPMPFV